MIQLQKKIVPIVVADDFDWSDVRAEIAKLNFIFFSRETDDYDVSFNELCESIFSDFGYLELHSKFSTWALEWGEVSALMVYSSWESTLA